ncbi:hypothetical protein NP493_259g00004 [Ridgeia piscesae]|uniref:Uncharacterized protein n=1 Tax=Ridgeia piscesae TaxID=27915 RepID=A0AAD9NY83_RIDPI|nr:hypothetical protein NP493_259g00004 [Ridgeia piscesae]
MSLQKDFKWSDKVYTMKEFVDVFTYRLPQIIFIAVGWDGKDVDHTFSGDEMYRIAAVKRQRRVVAKHGSGYFVSIPATTKKKVDLFFPDGNVKKSVNMDELLSALATVGDGTLKMMFENDEKVSFSFGPDQGANISFGVMRVIDVYDERYLVGHSICDGKVYSPIMPVPIPVYMTIELAIAVGLVDGTDDDYYKVLADIEAKMKGGKIEINDTDGRWSRRRVSTTQNHLLLVSQHVPVGDMHD